MTFCWGVLLLLGPVGLLLQPAWGLDVCHSIEVSGAAYHNTSNRLYTVHPEIHCNDKPVWVDATASHYVYYLLDGFDGWMVSPTSCYQWGNFMVKSRSDALVPYDVTGGKWEEFNPAQQRWVKSDSFAIRCSNVEMTARIITWRPAGLSTTPMPNGACSQAHCTEGSTCVDLPDGQYMCRCENGLTGPGCNVPRGMRMQNVLLLLSAAVVGVVLVLGSLALLRVFYRRQLQSAAPSSSTSSMSSQFKYKPLDDTVSSTA